MKNAKQTIKQLIKDRASEGRDLRLGIQALKWKEEKPPVQRDVSGRKVTGKKALKAFRRPETGPQRASLWVDKRWVGSNARVYFLLLGLLRGRPYKTIEAKCHPWNKMGSGLLYKTLGNVLDKGLMVHFPETAIKAWLEGEPAPKLLVEEVVPAQEPPKPPSQRPSFLQRVAANLELWGFRCTNLVVGETRGS
jgi:hypothetical protein